MRWAASILLTVLLLPALLFSVYALIAVPFLFDAPGSDTQTATWVMAFALLSLPVMILASLIGTWIALPSRRSPWWYASLLLPGISLAVFIIAGYCRPGFM